MNISTNDNTINKTERVIKFRALRDDVADFNFKYGYLLYGSDGIPRIAQDAGGFSYTCFRGTEGQFTGLHDKNGRAIYEGDVVKGKPYLFNGKYIIGKVVFDEVKAMWVVEEIDEKYSEQEYLFETLKPEHETEVIGNIYENPELLKTQVA